MNKFHNLRNQIGPPGVCITKFKCTRFRTYRSHSFNIFINCFDVADIRRKRFNVTNMNDLSNSVPFTNIVSFFKEVRIHNKI